jgi:hypothetical protein
MTHLKYYNNGTSETQWNIIVEYFYDSGGFDNYNFIYGKYINIHTL